MSNRDFSFFGEIKNRFDLFPNRLFDFICGRSASNDLHALWLASRELEIAFAHGSVKFGRLLFHAVGNFTCGARAKLQTAAGFVAIEIKDKGHVRITFADSEFIDEADGGRIELARDTLVNGRRIHKAIRDHRRAGRERGLNEFAHKLRAARGEKKQLGFGRHRVAGFGKLEQLPDFLADGCAARLADDEHRNFQLFKSRGETTDLRRFSTTFRAFKGDENSARHEAAM